MHRSLRSKQQTPTALRPRDVIAALVLQGHLTRYQGRRLIFGSPAELRIGQYDILEPIGRGGMGTVYKARHKFLHRIDAIKVLNQSLSRNGVAIERFYREAAAAGQLHHENIVQAFSCDEHNGQLFLAMEYVAGGDLGSLVTKNGPLPVHEAARFILQAARGLEHAWQRGLIHRDIKPSNILIDQQVTAKLADFGLARFAGTPQADSLTPTGAIVGTVYYLSPEQGNSDAEVTISSDIYSLGCTLFYCLIGRPPFVGKSVAPILLQHQQSPAPDLTTLRSDVPADLARLVEKTLAKNPAQRFATPADLAFALDRWATPPPSFVLTKLGQSGRPRNDPAPIVHDPDDQTKPEIRLGPTMQTPSLAHPEMPGQPWQSKGSGTLSRGWPFDSTKSRAFVISLLVAISTIVLLFFFVKLLGGSGPSAPNAKPSSPPQKLTPLVRIPGGTAHLGLAPERIASHLASISGLTFGSTSYERARRALSLEPVTDVTVKVFWIERYEVTNEQYAAFCLATGHRTPSHWPTGVMPAAIRDLPVTYVSGADAKAYTRWAGRRLPTVEEWVRAAGGESRQLFPWGETLDENYAGWLTTRNGSLAPVTAFPQDRSPYGVMNMAGNARELTSSMMTVSGKTGYVVKGGGVTTSGASDGTVASRAIMDADEGGSGFREIGFRCAADKPDPATAQ
ncbi:MAG: SUMF1/EgtB/PvdO family nonheme iron enzyme [Planctomycetes bacterium]|nr:SUMF1/EgtB/PvdO family nonheme iron enzyme [Planctomycetota bacterium]